MRLFWVFGVMGLVACGGGAKPADNAQASAPDASASVDDSVASAAAAANEATTPDAGPPPPAATSSAPPAGVSEVPSSNEKDECTPVGVELEKSVRPKLRACYRDGKKKDPELKGTVRIAIDIDTLGKVKSIKIAEKTLPDAVAQCMLKVVKSAPFPEASKCPGKSITIPMTFPTPH
jgi:TonB family protein